MLRGVVRKEIFCESLSPLLRPTTKICEGCSGDFFCSKQTTCGEEGRKEGRNEGKRGEKSNSEEEEKGPGSEQHIPQVGSSRKHHSVHEHFVMPLSSPKTSVGHHLALVDLGEKLVQSRDTIIPQGRLDN
jgi:hypothetical protein